VGNLLKDLVSDQVFHRMSQIVENYRSPFPQGFPHPLWRSCGKHPKLSTGSGYPQFLHRFSTGLSTGTSTVVGLLTLPKKVFHSFHSPYDEYEFNYGVFL
jgi:hypothetical protein